MKCPSCENTLSPIQSSGVIVQACHGGCGGFWFDHYQLKKIGSSLAGSLPPGSLLPGGEDILKTECAAGVRIFRDVEHQCPKCKSTLLFKHFSDKDLEVEVDQCSKCSGLWIEAGKLATLQSRTNTMDQYRQAVTEYFASIFEKCVCRMDVTNPEVQRSAQLIVKTLRWISPGKFLPDEKPWWIIE